MSSDPLRMALSPIHSILTIGGIAGAIAMMITVTICARYFMHGAEEIPQILTYALSTIIGFYFGTGVSKPTPPNSPENSN